MTTLTKIISSLSFKYAIIALSSGILGIYFFFRAFGYGNEDKISMICITYLLGSIFLVFCFHMIFKFLKANIEFEKNEVIIKRLRLERIELEAKIESVKRGELMKTLKPVSENKIEEIKNAFKSIDVSETVSNGVIKLLTDSSNVVK